MHGFLTPLARREFAQGPIANTRPDQPQGRVANCRCHPPNLPVSALSNLHFQPLRCLILPIANRRCSRPKPFRWRQQRYFRWTGTAFFKRDTLPQQTKRCVVGYAFHLYPIGLGQLEGRVADLLLQFPIICQQHETFRVIVQATRRVNAWPR